MFQIKYLFDLRDVRSCMNSFNVCLVYDCLLRTVVRGIRMQYLVNHNYDAHIADISIRAYPT